MGDSPMTLQTDPIFTDPDKAREYLEAKRWPHGPFCPHCREADEGRISKMHGKAQRPGLYQCKSCRKQFTVTVGTVMERSHIPINTWLLATFLLSSSKKGMSAHQLHRMLGVTYKTAWFMAHRIREAMRDDNPAGPLGGPSKVVEADETYFGHKEDKSLGKRTKRGKRGLAGKRAVVALVERGGGVRTFHVARATKKSVRDVLVRNVLRTPRCTPTNRTSTLRPAASTLGTMPSATAPGSTSEGWSIPTRSRTISASSSAACAVCTSIAQRSTYTATLPSSISGTATAPALAFRIASAPTRPCVASKASGSHTAGLTKPRTLKQRARKLWRKRRSQ
jgi:transposase-like protein